MATKLAKSKTSKSAMAPPLPAIRERANHARHAAHPGLMEVIPGIVAAILYAVAEGQGVPWVRAAGAGALTGLGMWVLRFGYQFLLSPAAIARDDYADLATSYEKADKERSVHLRPFVRRSRAGSLAKVTTARSKSTSLHSSCSSSPLRAPVSHASVMNKWSIACLLLAVRSCS